MTEAIIEKGQMFVKSGKKGVIYSVNISCFKTWVDAKVHFMYIENGQIKTDYITLNEVQEWSTDIEYFYDSVISQEMIRLFFDIIYDKISQSKFIKETDKLFEKLTAYEETV